LKFTAKESGDFTSTWKSIEVGTRAFLEGPFGSFTIVPDKNLFLVMGGIGVTPAMSMLRTLKQKKDNRKVILIYGSENWENITFREELEELEKDLNMELVHILMEPEDDWEGEKGYVDQEFLERFLPENKHEFIYFICGPGPMMDITEIALRNLDVDWRLIYSERFEIV
jgi:predicted ferric reductase